EFTCFEDELAPAGRPPDQRANRQFDWRVRARAMFATRRASDRFELEFAGRLGVRVFSCSMTWVADAPGEKKLLLLTATDRTSERKAESTLRKELLTDSLTSLPNRVGFV